MSVSATDLLLPAAVGGGLVYVAMQMSKGKPQLKRDQESEVFRTDMYWRNVVMDPLNQHPQQDPTESPSLSYTFVDANGEIRVPQDTGHAFGPHHNPGLTRYYQHEYTHFLENQLREAQANSPPVRPNNRNRRRLDPATSLY